MLIHEWSNRLLNSTNTTIPCDVWRKSDLREAAHPLTYFLGHVQGLVEISTFQGKENYYTSPQFVGLENQANTFQGSIKTHLKEIESHKIQ